MLYIVVSCPIHNCIRVFHHNDSIYIQYIYVYMIVKPMLRVGLLAWATSCGGLGCAVTADKREVPDVDRYVKKSIILLSRIRVNYHNEDMG